MPESNQPLVTVAMVTYKSAPYVRMAIESVLASGYTNFELIISDDCSPDNTWDIICEYKDSRIRAFRNEINIGEYPNRNKCIGLAKGKYFIFIDGDDYIYPHGLGHFAKQLLKFPEAGMAIARPDSDHMIYPVLMQPEDFLAYHFLGKSLANQGFPSTMFKTELLNSLDSKFNDFISGDTFIKLKIGGRHSTILINDGLIWWRKTPGQASEKLQNGVVGMLDYIHLQSSILSDKSMRISPGIQKQAVSKFYIKIRRQLLSKLFRFQFLQVIKVLKGAHLNLKKLLFSTNPNCDEFQIGNSTNPIFIGQPSNNN